MLNGRGWQAWLRLTYLYAVDAVDGCLGGEGVAE